MSEQETLESQELKSEKTKPYRKKVIAITAASVAGVLVLAGTGLGLYRHYQVQSLADDCKQAVSTVQSAQQKLDTLVVSDDVVQALKISDKQVTDSKTIASLKQAVELASQKAVIPECVVDYFDFSTNPQTAVVALGKTIATHSTAVTDAVAAVNKSVAQKQLEDAQKKLKTAVESANKVLADSDGNVQDNATREALKAAIDAASKLLKDNKETDPAKYATKAIDDAVNQVNASIEAKRKADEEAAAQAAAAAAAQAQRSYTPTYNNYTGGGYSNGNNGGSSSSQQGATSSGGGFAGFIGGGEGVGSADDCDAACQAPIVH